MVLEMEMSKTYQYRKVMKPMLERKRRARINKCLDELKDIMVECLTQEGEHITRLEKADILELTVEHMKKLRAQKQLRINNNTNNNNINQNQQQNHHQLDNVTKVSVAESFRAGYVHAANEVSKTLATVPGVSVDLGTQLMSHLGHRLNYLQVVVPTAVVSSSSQISPSNIIGATTLQQQNLDDNIQQISSLPINMKNDRFLDHHNHQQQLLQVITPPPSECSSDRSCSPIPSDSGSVWRPW